MNRRHFLRNGLWIAAAPSLLLARKSLAQIGPSKIGPSQIGSCSPPFIAPPCTTQQENVNSTIDFSWNFGASAGFQWIAQKFTSTSSATARCGLTIHHCHKTGSASLNVKFFIYTHTSDHPNTSIGGSAGDLISTAPSSDGDWTITWTTPTSALSGSTTYWLVGQFVTIDGTNYLVWNEINGAPGAGGNSVMSSPDGTTWTEQYANGQLMFTLYST